MKRPDGGARAESKPIKARKCTNAARKEEIAALASEMETLQAELAVLRNRALFEDSEAVDQDGEDRCRRREAAPRAKGELTNALLRQAIRKQQLSVTSLQGALSGYLVRQSDTPLDVGEWLTQR